MNDIDEQCLATMKDIGLTETDFEVMRKAWTDFSSEPEHAAIPVEKLLLIKAGFYSGYAAGRAH